MGNSASAPDSRIVETEYGKVQGRRLISEGERQVDAFKGIPYAKAPIGELRFEIQAKGRQSEDCLWLNVFSPCWEPPEGGFAVMVFIHGGAFSLGESIFYGDKNICEALCLKDVIVVTIQYRLGYLGFWTTGDSVCPGNLALWDQTAALQWVQSNIAAFGGNKDNVTVMGQSAGGVCADLLALSPVSSGLFHKVIPMGGNASSPWAFAAPHNEEVCERTARKMGIKEWKDSTDLMEQLRALPASAFVINDTKYLEDLDLNLECTPVIDGEFLPVSVDEMRKRAPAKPMMTGVVKMEAVMLFIDIKRKGKDNVKWAADKAVSYDDDAREMKIEKLIREYIDLDTVTDKNAIHRAFHEVASDIGMNAATLKMVKHTIAAHPGNAVYSYVFSYLNPKSYGLLRWFLRWFQSIKEPTHGMELQYLFGRSISTKFTFNEADKQMCDVFTTAFTNFAKYGNPNGASSDSSSLPVAWEPAAIDHLERHYVFDNELRNEDKYFDGRPGKMLKMQDTCGYTSDSCEEYDDDR